MKHSNSPFAFFIFIFFLFIHTLSFSQKKGETQTAAFTLNGKIFLEGKPAENVSLELSKDGQPIKKIITTKNGKYSFAMNQDTMNTKNEFIIHVIKEGTVPKALIINTYIPKEEYDDNTYEYVLEITLIPTTVNDIVIQRPSAKIKWNEAENGFGIDQVYAKIIQKEEERLKTDPDKYLKELAEKQKKEKEEEAKKKMENITLKVVPKVDSIVKEKEEKEKAPEIVIKENLNAIKTELKTLPKADTIVEKSAKQDTPVQAVAPVINTKQDVYDESMDYALKKDRVALQRAKEKTERKKNANLATKYETSNVMSSLLDAVDEHDKKLKK
jgi:hypothetical protein